MKNNGTASVLQVCGVIAIILGFISGIILGNSRLFDGFSWGVFLGVFISFAISGLILIGIGEVISLLSIIYDKQADIMHKMNELKPNEIVSDELPDL